LATHLKDRIVSCQHRLGKVRLYRPDEIRAVLATGFDNVIDAGHRIDALSKTRRSAADFEPLAAAFRIKQKEGGMQALLRAWYEEWRTLGERIERIGDACLARGHKVSARDAFFRASEYFRSADFYLHDNPENPAILELWDRMDSCFEKARRLSIPSRS